jgi:hypothetical protein
MTDLYNDTPLSEGIIVKLQIAIENSYRLLIEDFKKESIIIEEQGEHYNYFKEFFNEIFYNHKEDKVRKSIGDFFVEMFDRKKPFTKSDLDVILSIYRSIDGNMSIIY